MTFISNIYKEHFVVPAQIVTLDDWEMKKDKYSAYKSLKRDGHILLLDDFSFDGIVTTDVILAFNKIHDGFFVYLGENQESGITIIIANAKYPFLTETTLIINTTSDDLAANNKITDYKNRINMLDHIVKKFYNYNKPYLLYTNRKDLYNLLFENIKAKEITNKQKLTLLLNLKYQYNKLKQFFLYFTLVASIVLAFFIKSYMIEDWSKETIREYNLQSDGVQVQIQKVLDKQVEVQKEIDKYLSLQTKKVYHEN